MWSILLGSLIAANMNLAKWNNSERPFIPRWLDHRSWHSFQVQCMGLRFPREELLRVNLCFRVSHFSASSLFRENIYRMLTLGNTFHPISGTVFRIHWPIASSLQAGSVPASHLKSIKRPRTKTVAVGGISSHHYGAILFLVYTVVLTSSTGNTPQRFIKNRE